MTLRGTDDHLVSQEKTWVARTGVLKNVRFIEYERHKF